MNGLASSPAWTGAEPLPYPLGGSCRFSRQVREKGRQHLLQRQVFIGERHRDLVEALGPFYGFGCLFARDEAGVQTNFAGLCDIDLQGRLLLAVE